jgi:hypothetical protein
MKVVNPIYWKSEAQVGSVERPRITQSISPIRANELSALPREKAK